jgi:osmotically inducible protein OsmC
MEKLYTGSVTAKGGRDGHVKSSDGVIDFEIRKPRELGGQGGATNPEQLFAAAWGSCYLGALGSVAEKAFVLSADLDVHIPGVSREEAQLLADKAHKGCPYSKATRGNVETRITAI